MFWVAPGSCCWAQGSLREHLVADLGGMGHAALRAADDIERAPSTSNQGEPMHLSAALRPYIATVGVVPAKRRRNDQLVQEKHMTCEAMLNFAAILTVYHVLAVPTTLLGDRYRHGFNLRRCFEARVP